MFKVRYNEENFDINNLGTILYSLVDIKLSSFNPFFVYIDKNVANFYKKHLKKEEINYWNIVKDLLEILPLKRWIYHLKIKNWKLTYDRKFKLSSKNLIEKKDKLDEIVFNYLDTFSNILESKYTSQEIIDYFSSKIHFWYNFLWYNQIDDILEILKANKIKSPYYQKLVDFLEKSKSFKLGKDLNSIFKTQNLEIYLEEISWEIEQVFWEILEIKKEKFEKGLLEHFIL